LVGSKSAATIGEGSMIEILAWMDEVFGHDVAMHIPTAVVALLPLIPVLYLLKRVGMSLAWALLLLLPFFGLIVLVWVMAFWRWKRPT
jgi:uncharacterized membrane protein YhaH (DUF805 family)